MAGLGLVLLCIALIPLNEFSGQTRLFDAAVYFARLGGPFTANAGALGISSAVVLLAVMAVVRRRRRRISAALGVVTVAVVAGVGPYLLGALARGIATPLHGVDASLWLIWEVPIFLAAVLVLLAGAAGGGIAVGRARGFHPAIAPSVAAVAAAIAPAVWSASSEWPAWFTGMWIVAIATLALSRQTRFMILTASIVAALGATTLVWRATARGRMELAVHDLSGLAAVDPNTPTVLRHFAATLAADSEPTTRAALLESYVRSDLEAAGHPVALSAWPTNDGPVAEFQTAYFPRPSVREAVARARATRLPVIDTLATDSATIVLLAAPALGGGVTAVAVAPNSQLFPPDSSVRLYGLNVSRSAEPPYALQRLQSEPVSATEPAATWVRRQGTVHGEWIVRTGAGATRMHIEVDLRPIDALDERGILLVLIDLATVGILWLIGVAADGGVGRWIGARRRRLMGSFRIRLSLALFGFFVVPAAAFAIWSYRQVVQDTRQTRHEQVFGTLKSISAAPALSQEWITGQSRLARTPLLLYRGGELQEASDPVLETVAPFGRFLTDSVDIQLEELNEGLVSSAEALGSAKVLVGFRPLVREGFSGAVLAAPLTADDLMLGRRRRDLGVLLLMTTVLGAIAAFGLSGIAARQLARPIGTLRTAALSLAAGAPLPPLEGEPTAEFSPVFAAFRRMASDLNASRSALEDAQRRTSAVLRNVASGVIAVNQGGSIMLANPRAGAILEAALDPGSPLADAVPNDLALVLRRFLDDSAEEDAFEIAAGPRQLRGRITRLERGGAVVTIDDVTDLARAQRVLAWGEMARQIAHEIKNPLTPIRLGVQHLKRARADGRVDFDRVLDQNVARILAEIDRLDEIARAFSKYGSGHEERVPGQPTDIAAVVRDTVGLEQMGAEDGVQWELQGVDAPLLAIANAPELKEVLLNLLENARHARARRVTVDVSLVDGDAAGARAPRVQVAVRDDGGGIPADILPRIFEPH
ncbi:MAG TPA: ATP-binding protein, partial [Gemmatimonadaceae bacterium]|nr:ATP-binding protein [Gemmatimonadaceae bacterium]